MTNTSYGKLTATLIGAWFLFALAASSFGWFHTAPNQPPLPLLLAVLTPLILFAVWYWRSKSFRDFVLSLNPTTLTLVLAWRIAGFVFLPLYTYRILPGILALPAGWGDIFIGTTALLVATKWANQEHRTGFIVWQLLGITDLVTAIGLGAAAGFLNPDGLTGAPMTLLPLSLIPTFAVPLLLILHLISIAQARRWATETQTNAPASFVVGKA
jgi:hypothetical protein